MAKIKYRIPIVRCRTEKCETDLDYLNMGHSGIGALPPFDPYKPHKVLVPEILPDPKDQTCPVCRQTHRYSNVDIEEKAILEPEVGDTVLAHGQNGRFELTALKNSVATIKLLANDASGPVDLKYVIEVPYSTLTVLRSKEKPL